MNQLRPILLLEDDERDIELTLAALREQNIANDVEVVCDGEAELDCLYRRNRFRSRSEEPPVVVLLDLKMPKVSGLDVLREIKVELGAQNVARHRPHLLARGAGSHRELRARVNAYVVKPVEFDEFVSAIKQLSRFWAVVNHLPSAAGSGAHGVSREP